MWQEQARYCKLGAVIASQLSSTSIIISLTERTSRRATPEIVCGRPTCWISHLVVSDLQFLEGIHILDVLQARIEILDQVHDQRLDVLLQTSSAMLKAHGVKLVAQPASGSQFCTTVLNSLSIFDKPANTYTDIIILLVNTTVTCCLPGAAISGSQPQAAALKAFSRHASDRAHLADELAELEDRGVEHVVAAPVGKEYFDDGLKHLLAHQVAIVELILWSAAT